MKTRTIALLYEIAFTRALGDEASSACLYLGRALALRALHPPDEYDPAVSWIHRGIRTLRLAKFNQRTS